MGFQETLAAGAWALSRPQPPPGAQAAAPTSWPPGGPKLQPAHLLAPGPPEGPKLQPPTSWPLALMGGPSCSPPPPGLPGGPSCSPPTSWPSQGARATAPPPPGPWPPRGYLILVQLAVLVLLLPLLLEGDDDEAHEDVHHEEGDDDDVDDEEDGDLHAVVVNGALVLRVGVDGAVQQPGGGGDSPQRAVAMTPLLLAPPGPGSWKQLQAESREAWVQAPAPPLTGCVTWANHSTSLSLRFLTCQVETIIPDFPTRQGS